jgi:hypothetical protein
MPCLPRCHNLIFAPSRQALFTSTPLLIFMPPIFLDIEAATPFRRFFRYAYGRWCAISAMPLLRDQQRWQTRAFQDICAADDATRFRRLRRACRMHAMLLARRSANAAPLLFRRFFDIAAAAQARERIAQKRTIFDRADETRMFIRPPTTESTSPHMNR